MLVLVMVNPKESRDWHRCCWRVSAPRQSRKIFSGSYGKASLEQRRDRIDHLVFDVIESIDGKALLLGEHGVFGAFASLCLGVTDVDQHIRHAVAGTRLAPRAGVDESC